MLDASASFPRKKELRSIDRGAEKPRFSISFRPVPALISLISPFQEWAILV